MLIIEWLEAGFCVFLCYEHNVSWLPLAPAAVNYRRFSQRGP